MKKGEFNEGEQVRIKFMHEGQVRLGDWGYVVEYKDRYTIAILVTHNHLGEQMTKYREESPLDLIKTGEKYKP